MKKEGKSINWSKKKRIRGGYGYSRTIISGLVCIVYYCILIILSFLTTNGLATLLTLYDKFLNIKVEIWIRSLGWLPLLILVGFVVSMLERKKYLVRSLRESEYQLYMGRNLIHYTDQLSEEDIEKYEKTGEVHLISNGSARSNYSMKLEDREAGFVWFHISDSPGSKEPGFDSFWYSHATESTPRLYKVIIPINRFSQDMIQIRPIDGAVVIRGDIIGPAQIDTKFPWYNEKLYLRKTLRTFSFFGTLSVIYLAYLQTRGKWIDQKRRLVRGK